MTNYLALKTLSATTPALVPLVWSIEREAIAALLNAYCGRSFPAADVTAMRRRNAIDGTCGRKS